MTSEIIIGYMPMLPDGQYAEGKLEATLQKKCDLSQG